MSPRALAAPLHRHTREDEYSYVLEGRMGALLGDDVVEADRATSYSSRATSGTRSGTRATSPAGSRDHRAGRLRALLRRARRHGRRHAGGSGGARAALNERYGLEMRPETVPSWSSASGCGSASRSRAAGRRGRSRTPRASRAARRGPGVALALGPSSVQRHCTPPRSRRSGGCGRRSRSTSIRTATHRRLLEATARPWAVNAWSPRRGS